MTTADPQRRADEEQIPNLVLLTAAKGVSNTALRWIGPFLPTLERAFGATTTQLTTVLGIGELAGLSTLATGRHLDAGRERAIMAIGLAVVSAGTAVALLGTVPWFAVSMVLVVLGVSNITVAGHAYFGHRVPFRRRARAIGLYETSWALSLLVGAPVVALAIAAVGWRGPFVLLSVLTAIGAFVVASAVRRTPDDGATAVTGPTNVAIDDVARSRAEISRSESLTAWLVVLGSGFVALAGLGIFAVSGSWLDDAFGVSTGGLGVIAMGFGAAELVSSLGSASFADRLGTTRTTVAGLVVLLVGLAIMAGADDRIALGVAGILCFLFGFEFAIVTSFSLVTEALPAARGRTIARAAAIGTIARGTGAVGGGWLYGRHGIAGTATLSGLASLGAIACFVGAAVGRRR